MKVELDFNEQTEDPKSEAGLNVSFQAFDTYNDLGTHSLREVMGTKQLLATIQGVMIADASDSDSKLRVFLENLFDNPNTRIIRVEVAISIER